MQISFFVQGLIANDLTETEEDWKLFLDFNYCSKLILLNQK